MAAKKQPRSLADYVAGVISPVLIMAMVGSLVFYLLEVLYVGKYTGRLQWVLFFFVFGAVLIARISMIGEIAHRAGLYGTIIALLTALALIRFIDYPEDGLIIGWAVNLLLMALIWWCAHKLTWDCTLTDEDEDRSGEGLLHAAGMDEPPGSPRRVGTAKQDSGEAPLSAAQAEKKNDLPPATVWERFLRWREARRQRPHTPGVWIVYFSLAALPLFGLGQWLIPQSAATRRWYAFLLLAIYVSSGLGLLVTTCFTGLRRYLRQRKLQMPAAMAGIWLAVGAGIILVLLVLAAVIPRPNPEFSIAEMTGLAGSRDREASKYAVKQDSQGKGEGRSSTGKPSDRKGEASSGKPSNDKGQQGKPSQDGSQSGSSQGPSKDAKGGQGKNQQNSGNSSQKDQSKSGDGSSRDQSGKGEQREGEKDQDQSDESGGDSSSSKPLRELIPHLDERWVSVIRWIVYIALAIVGGYFLLKFLANFSTWARSLLEALRGLWQSLFGRGSDAGSESAQPGEAEERPVLRPFSSYRNPFLNGATGFSSVEELVRYSFEALEAYAQERGMGRQPYDTPLEFASRLGERMPSLEKEVARLADLYARANYSRASLPNSATEAVKQFWHRLTPTAMAEPVGAEA